MTMLAVADVKIGFIQRQRLNARGIAGENFADMVRGFFVGIKAASRISSSAINPRTVSGSACSSSSLAV
ncbi:hypothetical protein, partial [Acinetobacter baumannii]|uniref:hypothetical protein n=1 Tax=Acinetobacter baumannii TaxID=470 RepID=UPI0022798264